MTFLKKIFTEISFLNFFYKNLYTDPNHNEIQLTGSEVVKESMKEQIVAGVSGSGSADPCL
jgi:hypothetical protein